MSLSIRAAAITLDLQVQLKQHVDNPGQVPLRDPPPKSATQQPDGIDTPDLSWALRIKDHVENPGNTPLKG